MKVRIGIGTSAPGLDAVGLCRLGDDIDALGFDSLWLPEVLSAPGLDPMVALAWVGAHNPTLKLGTTALLPGKNPVRLAKQAASLDALSGGRLLLTLVPGLSTEPERSAIGVAPTARGDAIDELLPVLRALWSGAPVSHDGPSASFASVSLSPVPSQEPLEVWLGGMAPASLERCGRMADGWLPAMCTPAEVVAGRAVIDEAAERAGRAISPEHFGVSIGYATAPLSDRARAALGRRARGNPLEALVPVGLEQLRAHRESFIEVGFAKFEARPLVPPADWRAELEALADAVGDLQT